MKSLNKTLFLILMSLSLVFFNSCEKDEGTKASSDLIGTWNIDNSTVSVTVGGVDLVTYLMDAMELTQEEAEFMAGFFTDFGSMSGTVTFNDDNTYQAKMVGEEVENGTWSISSDGKTLSLKESGDSEDSADNLTIITLTPSNLVIALPAESEMVDLDDDGTDETQMDISIELRLSK